MIANFQFHSSVFLFLFILFIPLIIRDVVRRRSSGVKIPSLAGSSPSRSIRIIIPLLKFSKYLILSALILAMARPRTFTVSQNRDDTKGIDIILTVDVSLSMLAKDLEPDRLEALKKIAIDFVSQRPSDRIGLVTYSGEALTKVPVTFDHQVLKEIGIAHV